MIQLTIGEIIEATGGVLLKGCAEAFVCGISTDSRKVGHGHLFIPLRGENFDGHDYIWEAFKDGAIAALTEIDPTDKSKAIANKDTASAPLILIKVDNTLKALQDIAAYYRNRFTIPFVGITGSVGKTSTKEMVACALGAGYNVLKNEGNFNNEIGVPLTIFTLEPEHEAAVVEMGMSGFSEIRTLAGIVRPQVGIITNIGISHIERLGTRQNILKAKLELLEGLQPGGLLILNGDDGMLSGVKGLLKVRTLSYGLEEGVDFQAYNVRSRGENGVDFNIMVDRREYSVNLPAPGVHNVYNALAAFATGHELGIDMQKMINGITNYSPGSMRLNIIKANGMTVINDAYNASPQSVKAAIDVLEELDAKRRIAVLGDMLELGDWSIDAHLDAGRYVAASRIDKIIAVGTAAIDIARGAVEAGFSSENVAMMSSNVDAMRFLRDIVSQGDAILVKGSRGMKMEEIVNGLTEAN
jgi:UDP-N-acetylmuramoyl-tripeptide--D-alanyl-D-alanine ligase